MHCLMYNTLDFLSTKLARPLPEEMYNVRIIGQLCVPSGFGLCNLFLALFDNKN